MYAGFRTGFLVQCMQDLNPVFWYSVCRIWIQCVGTVCMQALDPFFVQCMQDLDPIFWYSVCSL